MKRRNNTFLILITILFLNMNSAFANIEMNYNSDEIFDSNKSVMLLIDSSNGDILDANKTAREFYGYSRDELIRMKISEINILGEKEIKKETEKEVKNNKIMVISFLGIIIVGLFILLSITNRIKKNEQYNKSKFKSLFDNMNEGFALHEIILDKNGLPIDYRFLEANFAFEKITGLKINEIKNKTVKEVFPNTEKYWIDSYGDVAINGKNMTFSNYSVELDKYFNVNVYSPLPNHFVTIFTDVTIEKKAQEQIEREKIILETILEDTLSGYWDWDLEKNYEYLSPSFKSMFGYSDDELENSPESWQRIIFKEDFPLVLEQFEKHISSKGEIPFYNEARYHHKNGSTVWVICSGRVIEWNDDKPLRMVGCHINITKIKELEKIILEERNLFKTTLHSIGDGVISTDVKGNIDIMNSVAEKLTGWSLTDARGLPFQEIFKIVNEYTRKKCFNPVEKVLETEEIIELENHTVLIKKNHEEVPIEDSAAPIRDDKGNIIGVVVVFRDCTEKKEKQEKIQYLSYHDQLTGLYNRHFFQEELKRLDIERHLPFTIAMLDVNGLKLTNDAFGHKAGDMLLKRVSEVLKNECRVDDIISRVGGDEFIILLPKTRREEAELIVKRIYKAIGREKIDNIIVSVSIGWETKETIEQDIKEIFSKAEDFMYRKKITESQSMRNQTIKVIMHTLHEANAREKIHSERVSKICRKIGKAMKLDDEVLNELEIVGLMHDIGKIAISNDILNKPGKLTKAEYEEIKRHPEISYHILKSADVYTKLAEYVLSHHERWDGKGYPRGISGEDIPRIARILTVADAYEAMTADRPYKKTFTHQEAIEELKSCAGKQFDLEIVQACEKYCWIIKAEV